MAPEKGDQQNAFIYSKKTLELYPGDKQARDLFDQLAAEFRLI